MRNTLQAVIVLTTSIHAPASKKVIKLAVLERTSKMVAHGRGFDIVQHIEVDAPMLREVYYAYVLAQILIIIKCYLYCYIWDIAFLLVI